MTCSVETWSTGSDNITMVRPYFQLKQNNLYIYFASELEKVSEKMLHYFFTDLLLCYHFIFNKLKP